MFLVVGLGPDPLGKLQRSPRPPSRNRRRGPTSKGKGGKGKGRERKEEGKGGRDWERRVREGDCLLFV